MSHWSEYRISKRPDQNFTSCYIQGWLYCFGPGIHSSFPIPDLVSLVCFFLLLCWFFSPFFLSLLFFSFPSDFLLAVTQLEHAFPWPLPIPLPCWAVCITKVCQPYGICSWCALNKLQVRWLPPYKHRCWRFSACIEGCWLGAAGSLQVGVSASWERRYKGRRGKDVCLYRSLLLPVWGLRANAYKNFVSQLISLVFSTARIPFQIVWTGREKRQHASALRVVVFC